MTAFLNALEFSVPDRIVTNDELAKLAEGWTGDKIYKKTGIRERRVAAEGQTAADLAYVAAEKLFDRTNADKDSIDTILFCTQSPDYYLPTSACILQDRLELPTNVAAIDYNLGCSGFTYGLWLSRALITSQSANNVLLLVADTYSKYCEPENVALSSLFGDGAAAGLITSDPSGALARLGPSVLGTDGRGAENLIVRRGCARHPGFDGQHATLEMNGTEIFTFTHAMVKKGIEQLLEEIDKSISDVDLFLLHQANRFIIESIAKKMKLPPERVPVEIDLFGNTVSASIPILICQLQSKGQLHPNQNFVLAGFGVGYSWAMTWLEWLHEKA